MIRIAFVPAACFLAVILSAPGSAAPAAKKGGSSVETTAGEQTLWRRVQKRYESAKKKGGASSKELREKVEKLYKQAKDSGEDVPSDVTAWLKKDIEYMSRWFYKVESVIAVTDKDIEKRLNELGKERWECFQVIRDRDTYRLFCKRRKRSYLSMVPVKQLLELGGGSGE